MTDRQGSISSGEKRLGFALGSAETVRDYMVATGEVLLRQLPAESAWFCHARYSENPHWAGRILRTAEDSFVCEESEDALKDPLIAAVDACAAREPRLLALPDIHPSSALLLPITAAEDVLGVILLQLGEIPADIDERMAALSDLLSCTAASLERILRVQESRASEELYRNLVENAGDILVFLSPELRILEWNREAEMLLGWDSMEVVGREFLDLCVAPVGWPLFNDKAAALLSGEDLVALEVEGKARDGRTVQIAWRLSRLATVRNHSLGIVAVGRDVAEQRRTEQNLRLQVDRLGVLRNVQAIFHSNTSIASVINQVNRDLPSQLGIDRATLLIFDKASQSLITNSFLGAHEHVPEAPSGVQPANASISGLALTRGEPVIENNCVGSSLIPAEIVEQFSLKSCVSLPIIGSSGPLGVLRLDDLQQTGRFTPEEIPFLQLVAEQLGPVIENALLFAERDRVEQALNEERNFVHAVLDSTSSLIIVTDAEGRIVRFNKACQDISGYTLDEVLGKSMWNEVLDPEHLSRTLSAFEDLPKAGAIRDFENVWRSKTGDRHLICWSADVLRDDDGRITHVVGTGTEVTRQRRIEMQDELLSRFGVRLAGAKSLQELGVIAREIMNEAFHWDAFYVAVRKSGKGRLRFLEQWDTMDDEQVNTGGVEDFVATKLLMDGPLGPGTTVLLNREPQQAVSVAIPFGDYSRPSASLLFAPIRVGTEVLGVCSVQSYAPYRYKEEDEEYLLKLCDVMGPTLLRCRAEHETGVLLTLGAKLNVAASPQEVGRIALDAADQLFGFDCAFMHLISPEDHRVQAILNVDIFDGVRTEIPLDHPGHASEMSLRTMREGPQIILRSPDDEPDPEVVPFGNTQQRSASMIYAPIRYAGTAVGVMSIQSYEYDAYTEQDLPRLQALADFCGGTFERTRIEEQGRFREERYRQAIAGTGAVPYQKDYKDNSFVFVGEGIEDLTGYSVAEFDQKIWAQLVQEAVMHGEASGLDKDAAIKKTRAGELQMWRADIRIQDRHGNTRWLFDTSVQLLNDEGAPVGSLGILQDITDRKRAEDALRESEARFNLFMSNVPAFAFIKDDQGRYIYANRAWIRHFDFSSDDEWYGKTDQELLPDLAGPFAAHDREVLRTGETMEFIESASLATDRMRFALVHKFLLPGREGQKLLGGFAIDITDRKRAEEALRESEERYALAVQGSNDGLWDWDLRNNSVYYSPRWRSILGLTAEKLTKSPEEWLGRIHLDDAVHVRMAVEDHVAGGGPHFISEHRLLHADGNYRWVLVRGYAVRGTGGRAYRMAGSLTDVTGAKAAEEQLKHGAYHDTLTSLPNRKLFTETLARAVARANRRSDYMFGVLFLDLDRFKVINDSLGHAAGDQLLIEIARRLESCVRPGDTVARLGGDEFTVLLDDIADEADATRVATRIQEEVCRAFEIQGHEIFTTASIGISLSTTGYERPEDILRDSDTAMYRAKAAGKARHEMFDSRMHTSALEVLRLETDLRRAVEYQRDFFLVYQPVVDLASSRTQGFEALVRWRHPERGIISPTEFIPVAEETNLIIPLGNWIIREALRQLAIWRHETNQFVTMAINLSSAQFRQSAFVEKVSQMLKDSGTQPGGVAFELTESELMENAETLLGVMAGLKDLGIELHVDDFGTGYSSLAYLHRFPIDVLKIDRLFVSHLGSSEESNEIVRAIVSLGHSMKQKVIAEGIEKEEHLTILRELGCDLGQGYLFAKPLPAEEAGAVLQAAFPRPAQ